jgi:hypothetical protein
VEIHEPGKESKSVAAVLIDAGKDLELSSTGHYLLLLTGVSRRLQVHDRFKIALEFERGGRVVVDVVVEDAASPQHRHRVAQRTCSTVHPSDTRRERRQGQSQRGALCALPDGIGVKNAVCQT